MQLILETEATADISVKMATVEDSLDTKLKDSIENLCNGNKENIECPKNIITTAVADIDGDRKEHSDTEPELPSTAQDLKLELEINHDDHSELPLTVEEVKINLEKNSGDEGASNGNSYENSNNGIHDTDSMNVDGLKCKDKPVEETKVANAEHGLVDKIVTQEFKEISLHSKNCMKVDDNCKKAEENEHTDKENKIEDKTNNIDLNAKVLKILDTELKLHNLETIDKADNLEDIIEVPEKISSSLTEQVDEDISEMALEVDKIISGMSMPIDDDILEDVDPVCGNISPDAILTNKTESDIDVLKTEHAPENLGPVESGGDVEFLPENIVDMDEEKIGDSESETVVPVTLEKKEAESKSVGEIVDDKLEVVALVAPEQSKGRDVGKNTHDDASETIDKVPLEKREVKTKSVNELEAEKMDDNDVIQIESEQDSEVFDVIEKTDSDVVNLPERDVDDAQNVPVDNQTMTEVDTSKTVVNSSSEKKADRNISNLDAGELTKITDDKVKVLDVDGIKEIPKALEQIEHQKVDVPSQSVEADEITKTPIIKLSNTLDILSDDDDDDQPQPEPQKITGKSFNEKQCINIEDDDDIMLIDEDTDLSKKNNPEPVLPIDTEEKKEESTNNCTIETKKVDEAVTVIEKDPVAATPQVKCPSKELEKNEIVKETKEVVKESLKPLLPDNFLKSCKKNLADMTRDELEEFCILKIVESIVDRSNLGEIKSKLKTMALNIDEHKKKALMLTKQNRDLQLVLKSVQEEQKKKPDTAITPLKITRSVGMQVLMTEKIGARKKPNTNNAIPLAPPTANRTIRTTNQTPRAQKQTGNQQIPVPRLVPAAAHPVAKSPMTQNSPINNQVKTASQFNGARMSPPVQKAEKRPLNRAQSVTVDLTDDEPPAKVAPKSSPVPPVRLVSPQNLLSAPRAQSTTAINSPRKVYIPISGPQGQNIRPGQTIMLKSVPSPGPRQRSAVPNITRGPAPNVIKRVINNRHPAPLPDVMKQYQPPNWKALPPAPDLKLSKVENGIVISWKIEGYQEDSYEEIASYQLYAYQETSSPPSTALWKKIGDVKALPLPMACTLTQFMAGFKYYFAVRAVDVRSRLGPFSLPGSILLLNKM